MKKDELIAALERLRRYALKLTAHEQDAEDIVQDVLASVLEEARYESIDGIGYLIAAVRNTAWSVLRRRGLQLMSDPAAPETTERSHSTRVDLDAIAARTRIADKDRLVRMWRMTALGTPQREIARTLGCSVDAVKATLKRARQQLEAAGDTPERLRGES